MQVFKLDTSGRVCFLVAALEVLHKRVMVAGEESKGCSSQPSCSLTLTLPTILCSWDDWFEDLFRVGASWEFLRCRRGQCSNISTGDEGVIPVTEARKELSEHEEWRQDAEANGGANRHDLLEVQESQ
ncbi:unnamed protein product [Lepidochelys kempii]